jgi:transcriptional regulator with XRE-family HTH domain
VTPVDTDSPALELPPSLETSPLAAARIRRRLTVEQAAARSKLDPDEVVALEENRVWKFASIADALATAIVYATSLGVSEREARQLAGLPVGRRLVQAWSLRRWLAVVTFAAALGALVWFVAGDLRSKPETVVVPAAPTPTTPQAPPLPDAWEIQVDVYNGTRDDGAATVLANEIAGFAYRIGTVGNADRRDYTETRVYFPPGGRPIGKRLARELGVKASALPGGDDPRRLVVVVGGR